MTKKQLKEERQNNLRLSKEVLAESLRANFAAMRLISDNELTLEIETPEFIKSRNALTLALYDDLIRLYLPDYQGQQQEILNKYLK